MSATLDGMNTAQLKDLIARAEATIKSQAAQKLDKYLVTPPVPTTIGMVCVAADGTLWYTNRKRVDWEFFDKGFFSGTSKIGVEYAQTLIPTAQYKDIDEMNRSHRIEVKV